MSARPSKTLEINLRRTAILDTNVHLRMRLPENLQIRRQLVQSDTENRRNAQLAGHQILQIVNSAFQIPKNVHHLMAGL